MSRMHDAPSKPASPQAPPARRGKAPVAFELRGDPAKALASLGLTSDDARVVVIPASDRVSERLRQAGAGRLMSNEELTEVSGAHMAGVRKVPRRPAIDKSAFQPDARSRAILNGLQIAQEDLREAGGAYDLEQVRGLMHGISRQRVDRRVKERTLFTVPGPSNRRLYPTVQFNRDGSVVEGLQAVLDALPTRNPWAVLNFFVHPDRRLNGRKPIDVLKQGDIENVVSAARLVAEQGG